MNNYPSASSNQRASYYSNPMFSTNLTKRPSMAHWVEEEKEEFKKQLSIHGKNWKMLAQLIPNKTEKQIRNFYQNYKKKMNLEDLLPKEGKSKHHGHKQATHFKHDSKKNKNKDDNKLWGLKRTRSFNKTISPFKRRNHNKRKVISSEDNLSSKSLSDIEEEKNQNSSKKQEVVSIDSNSSDSDNAKQPNKKQYSSSKYDESNQNSNSVNSNLSSGGSQSSDSLEKNRKKNLSYASNLSSEEDLD